MKLINLLIKQINQSSKHDELLERVKNPNSVVEFN